MMDMSREHLVAPARHRERGLALWVGLALGGAGIIVTIGGIYEWHKRRIPANQPVKQSVPRPAPGVPALEQPRPEEIADLRRQLAEERRARIEAEARAFQVEQEAARSRPRRCIDGVRFEQVGREWRNVGRC